MTFQENKRLLGLSLPGMNARRMADRHLFTQMSNAGQLNVVKYQAPTGIGSFDASFKAATMTYEITIKVYFEFLPEKIGDPNIDLREQRYDGSAGVATNNIHEMAHDVGACIHNLYRYHTARH